MLAYLAAKTRHIRLGTAVVVLPWMLLGAVMPHLPETPFAGQGGFLRYWFLADSNLADAGAWLRSRWMNFANTFVPLHLFADDGSFDVIDLTAAEHPRRSATLSGGETFLASLSLALALANMVTEGGGRLDAFFLDEGFGSLDEEHLDLAMEGIERLVTESADRLVVVVSHVPALRERIEDLIVLDRDPATGQTIVRRGRTAATLDRAPSGLGQ